MAFTEYETIYLTILIYSGITGIFVFLLELLVRHYGPKTKRMGENIKALDDKVWDSQESSLIVWARKTSQKRKGEITGDDYKKIRSILTTFTKQGDIHYLFTEAKKIHTKAWRHTLYTIIALVTGIVLNIFVPFGLLNFALCMD